MIAHAVHLAAGVALLLWSVRMIRTGIERGFMSGLKRRLKDASDNTVTAAAGGCLAALTMQSSTAVALIAAGFAESGMLAPASALAIVLGADLGSAIMARVLMLPVEAVIPILLLVGTVTFLRAKNRRTKQIGRILTGLALVLVSLGMIRETTAPISANPIAQTIAAYFEGDLASAFAIGALLAWGMHSSLAAVLTFATFATSGLVAGPVAAALVIGANLGGGVVPVALLWSSGRPARLVAVGNLLAKGCMTLAFLALLASGALDLGLLGAHPGQQAVALHIILNAVLLLAALPVAPRLIMLAERLLPEQQDLALEQTTVLDPDALDRPALALACAQRELLRMAETAQAMLVPVMRLFRGWDSDLAREIEAREDDVDRMHFETKIYVSQLRDKDLTPAQKKKSLEIVAMANSLEDAADRVAVSLLALARKMRDEGIAFSEEGRADLEHFHEQVVTNGRLALGILTTGDAEAARQLVAEKDRIRIEERALQERHLERLQQAATDSIATTNIHQETLRQLKQVNAALTYVAYPIAEETGELLGSRLARPLPAETMA